MKKTKILLIILPIIIVAIIIAVIIPVIVSAKKDEFEVPIINEQTIEEANQKERERLLAEKKKFEEDHPSQNESNTNSEQQPLERDEGIDASLAQTKELVDKTDSIISTFRAEEYKKIVSKLEIEEQNPDIIEVYSQLSEGRKEFYELIFRSMGADDRTFYGYHGVDFYTSPVEDMPLYDFHEYSIIK